MIVNTRNKFTKIIFGNSKRKNINKIINSKKDIISFAQRGKKKFTMIRNLNL